MRAFTMKRFPPPPSFYCLCLSLFALESCRMVVAQDLNGSIVGIVKDTSGAAMPASAVTVTNEGTGATTTGKVLDDGTYIIKVPPGVYDLRVNTTGFKLVRIDGLRVEVNTQSRADATLSVGETSEVVNVSAVNSTVDTTTSTLKETIGEQTIEDAPLNGRNPLSLILLVPGVTRDPRASVTSGNTYPGASGISINGNRSNTTNYILDGAANNDNYVNAPAPLPNPDALQEFSVQTNNFGAEFGR